MGNLLTILDDVKVLKSIIGETKSITPDLRSIFSMMGVGGKNKKNVMADIISTFAHSPYLILGVTKEDPRKLVDEIYKLKAKYYHPDNTATGNREKFIKIKNAYDKIVS